MSDRTDGSDANGSANPNGDGAFSSDGSIDGNGSSAPEKPAFVKPPAAEPRQTAPALRALPGAETKRRPQTASAPLRGGMACRS